MGLKKDYRDFLNEHFEGLSLTNALFYQWKNGLRFHLSHKMNWKATVLNEEYFDEVNMRASELFSAAFEPEEQMYLIVTQYEFGRTKIKYDSFVFRRISELTREMVSFSKEKVKDNGSLEFIIKKIGIAKLYINQINYSSIFEAIANSDFPSRKPRISKGMAPKNVFFINIRRKLIFHMYDDRGLDIIAAEKETLLPLFHNYNDWILDYDRPAIVHNLADLKT